MAPSALLGGLIRYWLSVEMSLFIERFLDLIVIVPLS
jgi:hypothetical protein